MLIIATFKHSTYLELALKLLQQTGVSTDNLLVAPLTQPNQADPMIEVQKVHQNGKSPFDLAFILATVGMLVASIYGFVLPGGPIIWSVVGIVFGALIGLGIDFLIQKKPRLKSKDTGSEVVVLVQCNDAESQQIEEVLWRHQATGLSKIPSYATSTS